MLTLASRRNQRLLARVAVALLASSVSLSGSAGEPGSGDPAVAWLEAERHRILERFEAANRGIEAAARDTARAQAILDRARAAGNVAATDVATQAVQAARAAAEKWNRLSGLQRVRGAALERAVAERKERGALREVMVPGVTSGEVLWQRGGAWLPVGPETTLGIGDVVKTGKDGYVELIFTDGTKLELASESTFTYQGASPETSLLGSITGRLHASVTCLRKDASACGRRQFRTRHACACVRGTEFEMVAQADGTLTVTVLEGVVDLVDDISGTTVPVGASERATRRAEGGVGTPERLDAGGLHRWWEDEGHGGPGAG